MLGKQFDGSAVGDGIGLRQVLHSFDEQALPIHITRISRAFAAFAPNLGRNRDRKNLGHAIGVSGVYKVPTDKRRKSSIPPTSRFTAQFYFYGRLAGGLPAGQPCGDMNLLLPVVLSLKTESGIFSFTLIPEYLARR